MNDKDYCKDLTNFDNICCMDLDTWLSDCAYTANRFRLTKDKLIEQCNIPERIERLAQICPVKYTVVDKNKDHSDCKEVSESVKSIICSGIDEFIKNCPYQSFIKGMTKEYLEYVSNINQFDCSTVEKVLYKPPPPLPSQQVPQQVPQKSSFFSSRNIFIVVLIIIFFSFVIIKWKYLL
jgi:hypothetical protein